ncbi:hypothetical protein NDU88_008034 [Pleurodeles waltl]|uniref:Uncharacterized protein n=1 Tax=Pleurodeles waltl TaxID=8319 RepID=A0AAV7QMG9_PLEWA|nr:hypothetical protein NDU88_008034 [Pleurodeles waltl]
MEAKIETETMWGLLALKRPGDPGAPGLLSVSAVVAWLQLGLPGVRLQPNRRLQHGLSSGLYLAPRPPPPVVPVALQEGSGTPRPRLCRCELQHCVRCARHNHSRRERWWWRQRCSAGSSAAGQWSESV